MGYSFSSHLEGRFLRSAPYATRSGHLWFLDARRMARAHDRLRYVLAGTDNTLSK